MAEKKETITYASLRAEVTAGKFRPIYVLQGEEPYYIDQLQQLIVDKALQDCEPEFNLNVFYGDTARVADVITAAKQYPTFAPRRVVMLREAQLISKQPGHKDDLDLLQHYAAKPLSSTVLVICHKGGDLKSKPFIEAMRSARSGIVFSSPKLRSDRDLRAAISGYVTSIGCSIDAKSEQMLADCIGADLSRMFGELDKLRLLVGADRKITPELIERNVGISKDFNNFELEDALRTRNAEKAYRIVTYFERNPKNNPVVVTVSMLFGFFSNVLLVAASRDQSPATLMSITGTKSQWRVDKFREAARNYSKRALVSIITHIRRCDARTKGIGSRQNEYDLLRELIFIILHS